MGEKIFKIGNSCMVISNNGSHGFPINTVVRIDEVLKQGYKCFDTKTFDYWFIEESDLNLVEAPIEMDIRN